MYSKIIVFLIFLFGMSLLGCSKEDSDKETQELTEQEIEAICKKTWENVSDIIGDKYLNATSPSDLASLLDDIKKLEYVEEAGYDDQSMFVKLKNGSVWGWLFNNIKSEPFEETSDINKISACNYSNMPTRASSTPHIIRKIQNEKVKILIFNQMSMDEFHHNEKTTWLSLKQYLENNGFEVTYKEGDYDMSDLHNYDLAILHTHGIYFNEAILMTSQLAGDSYSGNIETIAEVRNGIKRPISYKAISEANVRSLYSEQKLKEREPLIICTSCKALDNTCSLAETFNGCGASGFIGYTDASGVGMAAAHSFFRSLSLDQTIQEAIDKIPEHYKHQTSYTDDETGKVIGLDASLKVIYNSSDNKNYCYAHTCPDDKHPHLIDMGNGVKWSCCNIGADSPYSIGNYYTWGETSTKQHYSYYDNYEMMHNVRFPSNISATDNDAAWVNSSHTLRMPTASEFHELLSNSNLTWKDTDKDHQGAYIISKTNGNRLFMPSGGWIFEGDNMGVNKTCIWWSSERDPSSPFSWFMQIINENGKIKGEVAASRYSGHNVRGVEP